MSETEDVEGLADVENVERNLTMMRALMGDPRARATVDDAIAALRTLREQVERLRGERDADREHFREQIRDISRGAQAGAITVAARRWVQEHLKVQDNDIPADFEGFVLRMVERAERAEARVAELEAALVDISNDCYPTVMGTPLMGNQPMHALAGRCKQTADAALDARHRATKGGE